MPRTTVTRHNEAVAHDGNAVCASIGLKSGLVLATGGDDCAVNVWRLGRPHVLASFRDFKKPVTCVAFSASEAYLAGGSESGAVKVWSMERGKVKTSFAAHRSAVRCLAFHPRVDHVLASGGLDARVQILDASAGTVINSYSYVPNAKVKGSTAAPVAITCVCFSPPGNWLAAGDASGRVILWDLSRGVQLFAWEGAGGTGAARTNPVAAAVGAAPTGGSLAAGAITPGPGHRGAVACLVFHPDELLLVSGGEDRTVRLWDADPRSMARGAAALAVTPADAGPIRALAFLRPDPTGPACSLSSVTDTRLRVWHLPSLAVPDGQQQGVEVGQDGLPLVDPAPITTDVLDVAWPGVCALWVGANVRDSTSGSSQHLVAVALRHSFMIACGVDVGTLCTLPTATSGGYGGPGSPKGGLPVSPRQARPALGSNGARSLGPDAVTATPTATPSTPAVHYTPGVAGAHSRHATPAAGHSQGRGLGASSSSTSRARLTPATPVVSVSVHDMSDDSSRLNDSRLDDSGVQGGSGEDGKEEEEEEGKVEEGEGDEGSIDGYGLDAIEGETGPGLDSGSTLHSSTRWTSLNQQGAEGARVRDGEEGGRRQGEEAGEQDTSGFDSTVNRSAAPINTLDTQRAGAPEEEEEEEEEIGGTGVQATYFLEDSEEEEEEQADAGGRGYRLSAQGLQSENGMAQEGKHADEPAGPSIVPPLSLPLVGKGAAAGGGGGGGAQGARQGGGIDLQALQAAMQQVQAVKEAVAGQARVRDIGKALPAPAYPSQPSVLAPASVPKEAVLPNNTQQAKGMQAQEAQTSFPSDEELAADMQGLDFGDLEDAPPPAASEAKADGGLGRRQAGVPSATQSKGGPKRPPPPSSLDASSIITPAHRQERAPGDFVPSIRDSPVGLAFEAFLPDATSAGFGASRVAPLGATMALAVRAGSAAGVRAGGGARASPADAALSLVQSRRSPFLDALARRRTDVRACGRLWGQGDVRAALGAVSSGGEPGALADVLCAVAGISREVEPDNGDPFAKGTARVRLAPCATVGAGTGAVEALMLNMDQAAAVLGLAYAAMTDTAVHLQLAGVHASNAVFRTFCPILRSLRMTHLGPIQAGGSISIEPALLAKLSLDPNVEDRLRRAGATIEALERVRARLAALSRMDSGHGHGGAGQGGGASGGVTYHTLAAAARGMGVAYDSWKASLATV